MNHLRILLLSIAALLAGCGTTGTGTAPGGRGSGGDPLQRYSNAYLKGDARTEAMELERARTEPGVTPVVAARIEVTRCALQVASLVFEACQGFDRLRRDAAPADRAYADYVAGRVTPADVPLVPEQHRAIAAGREDAGTLQAIRDPASRLVAAGVLLRTGRATPQVVQVAVDTASQQGWRRALLAWLNVQAQRADRAGHRDEAERIRRRISQVGEAH
ncbi:hypothetical protein [Ramlibacter sp. PS4R-6]|uniref:hypothetical protein n=1 Tax=Ramlibacter sp. PS4R-6 TaxID=3133438 RepID=UPI00309BACBB